VCGGSAVPRCAARAPAGRGRARGRPGSGSVLQVGGQDDLAAGSEVGVVIAVVVGVVHLVGQVQGIQLQAEVLVDLVGSHGVEAPVGGHVGAGGAAACRALARAAVGLADIVGTRAHGERRQSLVGGPQAEAVL